VRVEVLGESRRAYRELLRAERVELVLSHYSTFGARIALARGIPNLQVLHNSYTWLDDGGARRLAWRLRRMSGFVAVSSSVADYAARRLHVPRERIEVIPNGVDAGRFSPSERRKLRAAARSELRLPESAIAFLLPGTYEPRKGQRAFLQAFERIARQHPSAVAICAGGAPQPQFVEECRRFAAERGLSGRVHLLPHGDPLRLYAAADALVLPSVVEGFSLSTLEAAAVGLPLVLTDVGGARDLLNRATIGQRIPAYLDDLAAASPAQLEDVARKPPAKVVDALAAAMSDLCARRDAWREKAQAGPALVAREFTIQAVAARYQLAMDRALGG
jgi:glycosyltransferase involved in cell wall biosynthesis